MPIQFSLMTRTEMVLWNIGLLTIQPHDTVASLWTVYWIQFSLLTLQDVFKYIHGKTSKITSACIIFKWQWVAQNKFFNSDINPKTHRLLKLMPHLSIILLTGIHITDICQAPYFGFCFLYVETFLCLGSYIHSMQHCLHAFYLTQTY